MDIPHGGFYDGFYKQLVVGCAPWQVLQRVLRAPCWIHKALTEDWCQMRRVGNNTDRNRGGTELETGDSRLRRSRVSRATLSLFLFDGRTTDDAAKHGEKRGRRCSHRSLQVLDPPTDDNGSLLA
ncbi:unnamed protein product, partial [Ixodes hexagonus]